MVAPGCVTGPLRHSDGAAPVFRRSGPDPADAAASARRAAAATREVVEVVAHPTVDPV